MDDGVVNNKSQPKDLTLAELKTKLNEVSMKDDHDPELMADGFAQMRAFNHMDQILMQHPKNTTILLG